MNYHAITVQVTFGVMAETEDDAHRIAAELTAGMADEVPSRATVSIEARETLNQAPYIHRYAVNFKEPA